MSQRKKIVILISGSGSNMEKIAQACLPFNDQASQIHADVALVLSNKVGVLGLERAHKLGIPTRVLSNKDFSTREAYDAALVAALEPLQPDLIVLAGFMRILSPVFVQAFPNKIFNIHPSLLPKYKGLHTHQRALDAGDTEHGVTVHVVNELLDDGPIIIQAKVAIEAGDTVDDLQQKVHQKEHLIYPLAVKWFCDDRLSIQTNAVYLDKQLLPFQGALYTPDIAAQKA